MLSPYRVLDLTDADGLLIGMLLAQLGAEVVAVEPPGGHGSRSDRPLWHEACSRGRVAVTGGIDEIERLAATADLLVECGAQAVDLDALRRRHRSLVTVSISPFGTTGPKADWLATDLTLSAASGQMILTGDADRPPVRISEPQAYHHASIEAAVHAVAALVERDRSGLGQHVDVSAQHALTQAIQINMLAAAVGAPLVGRHSGGAKMGPYELRFVYPAADGHVTITFLFGDMIGRFTQRLMEWVHERGCCSEEIRNLDYVRFFDMIYAGELEVALLTEATDSVARLTATMTKVELLDVALERQLLIAPVATTADTLDFEQFAARGIWDVVGGEGAEASVRLPGPWARPSATPLQRLDAAPVAGAADDRVDSLLARRPSVRPPGEDEPGSVPDAQGARRPLDGVRILDFSWVLAGPMATRLLADLGATVVRIESEQRPDVIRSAGPFMDGHEGPDATALWHSVAAGKHSLQLDITTEEGRGVALDLARWADLVVESFSPGTMEHLGLGYETLQAGNPSLVMLSSSLLGQDGPLVDFAGFGNLAAALTGFYEITGWPDRDPAGPFTAYTDYVSPRFAALACVAAVGHARRTGQGQYIDFAQAEAAIHLLASALLDQQVSGRTAPRRGNRDPRHAPHVVLPAGEPGEERWIALACTDDDQWGRLADLADLPEPLGSLGRDERHRRVDEIEAALAGWSIGRHPGELEAELQRRGVPAHQVQHSPEVLADPQLAHRCFAQRVPHPDHGEVWVEGCQARWSRTQPDPVFGGRPVGHDTHWVLSEVLGYDDDRIADLVVAGAIT